MKSTLVSAACAATVAAGAAHAGGIERRGDPSQILFEEGNQYLEFSVVHVAPNVSGTNTTPFPVGPTGNITESYQNWAFGYKHELNDKITLAFVLDEPVGADVTYDTAGAFFAGSSASVDSIAATALMKYQFTDRISAYGGLKLQGLSGAITVQSVAGTAPNPYTLNVDKDYQLGYLVGAAYEVPEIAMRVALTYESEIEHEFRDNTGAPFKVKTPQSVTLHAQSGIAANTLLFGSIRWREWTEFAVSPSDFAPAPIASGTSDVWTYTLGVGRKFSDKWSGAFSLGYEKDNGDVVGNLSGTDGYWSYGVAAIYQGEGYKITTGVRYIDIGSANTSVASFSDNDAVAVGMKVGWTF
ncbi:hypothetical protein [Roseovarius sp.]|uniref:hypothetical protein n=1 Tax=Roseovarius sp. TaxID=1486281 RepID=UPI000C43BB0B|nr:hypothetical protein [Roseovarius sp.]MAZ22063.1 hypothetical protein [Roseovarius sp.]